MMLFPLLLSPTPHCHKSVAKIGQYYQYIAYADSTYSADGMQERGHILKTQAQAYATGSVAA